MDACALPTSPRQLTTRYAVLATVSGVSYSREPLHPAPDSVQAGVLTRALRTANNFNSLGRSPKNRAPRVSFRDPALQPTHRQLCFRTKRTSSRAPATSAHLSSFPIPGRFLRFRRHLLHRLPRSLAAACNCAASCPSLVRPLGLSCPTEVQPRFVFDPTLNHRAPKRPLRPHQ